MSDIDGAWMARDGLRAHLVSSPHSHWTACGLDMQRRPLWSPHRPWGPAQRQRRCRKCERAADDLGISDADREWLIRVAEAALAWSEAEKAGRYYLQSVRSKVVKRLQDALDGGEE